MITASVVVLLCIIFALLVICLGVALHAWEMAGQAMLRVERMERVVKLMISRHRIAPEDLEKAARWIA